jgi:hypothetical protein
VTAAARVFDAVPLSGGAAADAARIARADIEVSGLEQAGPSFELRVFLGNSDADADTEPAEDDGYAGSIHVYGYGTVLPPDLAESKARPRLPMTRTLIATDAVRRAARAGPTASVTLVPVGYEGSGDGIDLGPVQVAILVDEGLA